MHRSSDVILLSTADWDNPFWTNKQFVASELARLGHRVLYIESLGLRAPVARSRDITRIFRRLKRGFSPPRSVAENVYVCSPVVIPLHSLALVRKINRFLLGRFVRRAARKVGLDCDVLWTYNPLSSELLDLSGFDQVVYHCVDEIKAQPGMPVSEIEQAEHDLLKQADITFVTSSTLYDNRRAVAGNLHLFENCADYDHFSRAMNDAVHVPQDLAGLHGPVIGFIGAISAYKVDFGLLEAIAQARPDWNIVLIGQVGEGEPGTSVSELARISNIHLFGPRDYADLPTYMKGFDVAIIPAALNAYTHSMFPMKFYEYLAAGRRIVSTRIASLAAIDRRYLTLADNADDFVSAIDRILDESEDRYLQERLRLASSNTYKSRTAKMLDLVGEALSS